jgi:transcriptional regulator GlxA family with amidase domain
VRSPSTVGILVYDGVTLLDVAGPAEVFKEANRFGADYRILLLSPTGDDVTSNLGIRISVDGQVAAEPALDTCRVEKDPIYVRDGSTYTSAGVTAGIDLALALVEEDQGPDLTRDVARALVVYMQRAGGQSQFSAPLQGPPPRSPALRKITDLVTANPRGNYSLDELAKHLNVSTRQLTRLFHDELSTTPARYVENIRFDLARAFLDQGQTATQAAALAGFPSYESMRRVFARKLSISPAAYQRRFSTTRAA